MTSLCSEFIMRDEWEKVKSVVLMCYNRLHLERLRTIMKNLKISGISCDSQSGASEIRV